MENKEPCQHLQTYKEVIMGCKTGDRICSACGETLMPEELQELREAQMKAGIIHPVSK